MYNFICVLANEMDFWLWLIIRYRIFLICAPYPYLHCTGWPITDRFLAWLLCWLVTFCYIYYMIHISILCYRIMNLWMKNKPIAEWVAVCTCTCVFVLGHVNVKNCMFHCRYNVVSPHKYISVCVCLSFCLSVCD